MDSFVFVSGKFYMIKRDLHEPDIMYNKRVEWIIEKLKTIKDPKISKLVIQSRIFVNNQILGVEYSDEINKLFLTD
jgi:hypothetical protein